MVGLPPDAGPKFPAELSGGMVKRAGLARALALDPALLFLDEPTAGLDPIGAAKFDELIRELADTMGLTVFLITHDLDSLYATCDRVAVLAEKKVIAVEIGRAHVCTPVTNAHLVCRLLLAKKKTCHRDTHIKSHVHHH